MSALLANWVGECFYVSIFSIWKKSCLLLTKLDILLGLLSLSSCFVINSMIVNYFMRPQMETVKHVSTFLSEIIFGFLWVHLHPSSTAQQQRKENTQSRYLNEMGRYGAASLNTLISAPCRPRWSKANTMHISCLKMSFSFCVRALCCLAEKALEFLLFCSFLPLPREEFVWHQHSSVCLPACLSVSKINSKNDHLFELFLCLYKYKFRSRQKKHHILA